MQGGLAAVQGGPAAVQGGPATVQGRSAALQGGPTTVQGSRKFFRGSLRVKISQLQIFFRKHRFLGIKEQNSNPSTKGPKIGEFPVRDHPRLHNETVGREEINK